MNIKWVLVVLLFAENAVYAQPARYRILDEVTQSFVRMVEGVPRFDEDGNPLNVEVGTYTLNTVPLVGQFPGGTLVKLEGTVFGNIRDGKLDFDAGSNLVGGDNPNGIGRPQFNSAGLRTNIAVWEPWMPTSDEDVEEHLLFVVARDIRLDIFNGSVQIGEPAAIEVGFTGGQLDAALADEDIIGTFPMILGPGVPEDPNEATATYPNLSLSSVEGDLDTQIAIPFGFESEYAVGPFAVLFGETDTRLVLEAKLTLERVAIGDIDGIDGLTVTDIDRLVSQVALETTRFDRTFDLDWSGILDNTDVELWLAEFGTRNGDANLDGAVNFADFLTLSGNFGKEGTWSQGNFDGQGTIAFPDFLILSRNFGEASAAPVSVVPEPSSAFRFASLFTLILLLQRRTWKGGCCESR